MPGISLVVCLHGERTLFERLLSRSVGCFDDLVAVHDGPDTAGLRAVVEGAGGQFFEEPRRCQQEPHWPMAWARAKHDWILRLDADEFPSNDLCEWLRRFREAPDPPELSGYTCIWPLWSGVRTVSRRWPAGRSFLFHRQRVRFFGMAEQVPVADGTFSALSLVLHHQPLRKSFGIANVLFRRQAFQWRRVIAKSLLGRPTDLACWRWESPEWPPVWEAIRRRPIRTGLFRLLVTPLFAFRIQWREEGRIFPGAALNGSINHFLICLKYWSLRRQHRANCAAL
jgi:hypothetical protein